MARTALTDSFLKGISTTCIVSDAKVERLRFRSKKEGKYKSWLYRYTWLGKVQEISIGSYPAVSLAFARKKATTFNEALGKGKNPRLLEDEAEKETFEADARRTSFENYAVNYIETKKSQWKNEKHRKQWLSTLEQYAFPYIGKENMTDITTPLIKKLLLQSKTDRNGRKSTFWEATIETADRTRNRIEQIIEAYYAEHDLDTRNPASWDKLKHILPDKAKLKNASSSPFKAFKNPKEMRGLVKFLTSTNTPSVLNAPLLFYILTHTRPSDVVKAKVEDFELKKRQWVIKDTVKRKGVDEDGAQIVPLCTQALNLVKPLIETAREKNCEYVFVTNQTVRNEHISLGGLYDYLMKINKGKYKGKTTLHGMRASFATWAEENYNGEGSNNLHLLIEHSLGHKVGDATQRAYRRTDLLKHRRGLFQAWGDFCYGIET